MRKRAISLGVALSIFGLGLTTGTGGCSSILGIEEWEDPLSDSSGTTASGGGSDGDGGGGPAPTCSDGVKNGLGETDIDCGGGVCAPCGLEKRCELNADCESKTCSIHLLCVSPKQPPCEDGGSSGAGGGSASCNDCTLSPGESDVDCGGDACFPCGAMKVCQVDNDCLSLSCVGGSCSLGVSGKACKANIDCEAGTCEVGACWTGYCCP